ncbi:hypothetical protein GGR06_000604 [Bacteroides reticulotermitis]|uniref:Uncharacterized protein n=1 Tax=Bacteroides reticulotermitis TaxID=1133319 RepID=A0A840CW85_9BACE|nr:hypothetical protein [Bacteroides reticulotermitis]
MRFFLVSTYSKNKGSLLNTKFVTLFGLAYP